MTTTERPNESSTKAKFSEVYTFEQDGKVYECQTVELFGETYEVCTDGRTVREIMLDLVGEDDWNLSPETEARLCEFLDQYRIERDESSAE